MNRINTSLSLLFIVFTSFLWSQSVEVITQEKSLGQIHQMQYSPDGTLLASASLEDPSVKIWDVKSGKIIGKLDAHQLGVQSFDFNQKGTQVVVSGIDSSVVLWDIIEWDIIDSVRLKSMTQSIKFIDETKWVSYNNQSEVLQWDLSTFHQPKVVFEQSGISSFSVANRQLFIGTELGKIIGVNIQSSSDTKEIQVGEKEIIKISAHTNNQLVALDENGAFYILNHSLELINQIKIPSINILSFDINPDKEKAVIATNGRQIKVYDFQGKQLQSFVQRTDGKDYPITAISISPDGLSLASSGSRFIHSIRKTKNESYIQLWDLDRGSQYKVLKGEVNPIYSFDFHPTENKLVVLGDDRVLTFWNFETADKFGDFTLPRPRRQISPRAKKDKVNKGLKFIKVAGDLISGDFGSEDVKSTAENMVKIGLKRAIKERSIIKYSPTGQSLITKLTGDEIRVYDLSNRLPEKDKTIFTYQTNINNFFISPDEQYLVALGSGDSAISIIDFKTGNFIKKLYTPSTTSNLKMWYEAESGAFSPSGELFSVCFNTSKTYVYRTNGWYKAFESDESQAGYVKNAFVNFSADGRFLMVNTSKGLKTYDTDRYILYTDGLKNVSGTPLLIDCPSDFVASVKNNQLMFENVSTGDLTKSIKVTHDNISKISVKSNGLMGVTLRSGQFLLINPTTGFEEVTLVANGDNYIFKTKDNFYKVSKDGRDLVTFRIGNKALPIEQFDAIFNRPDLVLKQLESQDEDLMALYYKAFQKRIKKLGLIETTSIDWNAIPTVKVNQVKDIPAVTTDSNLPLSFQFTDQKGLLSYNLWVNDVPMYGKQGKTINGNEFSGKETIELTSGTNKIQVACMNEYGYESLMETFYIENTTEQVKPNLYLVAIGAAEYQNDKYNLNYPVKDAKDLVGIMEANSNKVYNQVLTKTLANEQVTVEQVLALKSFLNQSTVNDVVMVFVAGHGVLDPNFDYYFATYNMDFNDPKNGGLAYEDLESIIDGIKSRRKILIMDTCHSGEVDEEEVFFSEEALPDDEEENEDDLEFRSAGPAIESNQSSASPSKVMNELFNDLRRGIGATVISSAGGTEYAMESGEWKNGLFTYCMLMGLKTEKADLNEDGLIYLSELQNYVTEMVKSLSHGKQIPNNRIQNLELDFRVY